MARKQNYKRDNKENKDRGFDPELLLVGLVADFIQYVFKLPALLPYGLVLTVLRIRWGDVCQAVFLWKTLPFSESIEGCGWIPILKLLLPPSQPQVLISPTDCTSTPPLAEAPSPFPGSLLTGRMRKNWVTDLRLLRQKEGRLTVSVVKAPFLLLMICLGDSKLCLYFSQSHSMTFKVKRKCLN